MNMWVNFYIPFNSKPIFAAFGSSWFNWIYRVNEVWFPVYSFRPYRWTNAGILLIWPLGTNFSAFLITILTSSFKKMHLKVSSVKWKPFFLSLNVLIVFCCSLVLGDTLWCYFDSTGPSWTQWKWVNKSYQFAQNCNLTTTKQTKHQKFIFSSCVVPELMQGGSVLILVTLGVISI